MSVIASACKQCGAPPAFEIFPCRVPGQCLECTPCMNRQFCFTPYRPALAGPYISGARQLPPRVQCIQQRDTYICLPPLETVISTL